MKTFAILLIIFVIGYSQSKPLAIVIKARGTVTVQSKGNTKNARRGTKVYGEDIIKSGAGRSYAVLRFLDDRSTLRVRKNSSIKLQGTQETGGNIAKNVILEVGDVFASVVQQKGAFRVSTPTSVASVKGTKFQSLFDPDNESSIFFLTEGLLGLNFGSTELPDLSAGTAIRINKDGTFEIVPESDIATFGIVPFDESGPYDEIEVEFEDSQGNKKTIKVKVQDN